MRWWPFGRSQTVEYRQSYTDAVVAGILSAAGAVRHCLTHSAPSKRRRACGRVVWRLLT